jgi:hypothetical protein
MLWQGAQKMSKRSRPRARSSEVIGGIVKPGPAGAVGEVAAVLIAAPGDFVAGALGAFGATAPATAGGGALAVSCAPVTAVGRSSSRTAASGGSTGAGGKTPAWPLVLPANVPALRATVPFTGGREARPSAQSVLAANGL